MSWAIARRDLLKRLGVGAACLPLLHAGRARAATRRRNLIVVVQSLGYRAAAWQPAVGPFAGPLPPTLGPLEPYKQQLIVLPELTNPSVPTNASGLFAYGTILYGLEEVNAGTAYVEPGGKTVDQVVGDAQPNALRSVALSVVEGFVTPVAPAPGAAYCCWAGPRQPLVPIADPVQTYATFFAGFTAAPPDSAEVKRLLLERKSILDYVGGSLGQFARRLGTEDRRLIDGHLAAVRDLETTLTSVASPNDACTLAEPAPVDGRDRASYPKVLAAQMDLAVAALRCGLTRVVTLQLSDADARNVAVDTFIPGLPPAATGPLQSWYALAHNPVVGGVDVKQKLDQYFMLQFASLLGRLSASATPDGDLLASSVVLWANTMHDGADLDAQRVPWMLAGSAGGHFKTGQCLASAGKPIGGVLTEICHAMGVPGDPFGAPLPGLRA